MSAVPALRLRIRPRLALVLALLALAAISGPAGATPRSALRVTLVGDSVSASLLYSPSARAFLSRGFDLRLDLAVCRRLVAPSCAYRGRTPSTALGAVRGLGHSLGQVLVVSVGYNDDAHSFARGIDELMRAATADGARRVVWVTLSQRRSTYDWINLSIRAAAKRWPQLEVADWNAYSAGKPWFGGDGLHLTGAGADGLVRLLRPAILAASLEIAAEQAAFALRAAAERAARTKPGAPLAGYKDARFQELRS